MVRRSWLVVLPVRGTDDDQNLVVKRQVPTRPCCTCIRSYKIDVKTCCIWLNCGSSKTSSSSSVSENRTRRPSCRGGK